MNDPASQPVAVRLPRKLAFLLEPHRYKVAYGGRGSAKSWSFANALLSLGASRKLRILCAREIQRSIDNSVYRLLCDRIEALGLRGFFRASETDIVGANGTTFLFSGLAQHTVDSIKSFEGIEIVWVEEGQTVSKRSWDILVPTIRAPNSEIWVSFNPELETDDTWQRFVANRPPQAMVEKMIWQDNPWFPEVLEAERLFMQRTAPDDYDNIWEGNCRQTVAGAIYAREMAEMASQGRIRSLPYDPRLPVHTIWDLGWNDAMAIVMVQKPVPTVVNVIDYIEDRYRRFDEYVAELDRLRYRWGSDWLPHDGANRDPKSGKSAQEVLRGLGRRSVKIVGRGDVATGIRNVRMMFPRLYIDNSAKKVATGHAGAGRLVECLKHYRRAVPRATGEEAAPVHDEYSHGCDAIRQLAAVVDRLHNDPDRPTAPLLPAFRNVDPGMGTLG